MGSKKTLIIGASTNSSRYSYLAANKLVKYKYEIILLGLREGQVAEEKIQTNKDIHPDIDTITLYVGPQNQPTYYNYILETKPNRVIFNPGTENVKLQKLLLENDIEFIEACTLVMLSAGTY